MSTLAPQKALDATYLEILRFNLIIPGMVRDYPNSEYTLRCFLARAQLLERARALYQQVQENEPKPEMDTASL